MTRVLYSAPGETVYASIYRYRLVVAKKLFADDPYLGSWWCGYAEVLPEDGIQVQDFDGYDQVAAFDVPGGLTFGGVLDLMPGVGAKRQFLGFDTSHVSLGDFDLQKTMGAACELADQIIEYGKQRRKKRGAV